MKNKLYALIIAFCITLISGPQIVFGACEQDLDGDGDVDILDLAVFAEGMLDESPLFAVDFGNVCEYPNAPLLVSADYLEKMTGLIPNLVIIDARSTGYDTGHIPGAISLKWQDFGAPNLNSITEMEQMLTDKGIKRDFTFVVYDDTTASWGAAGRIFWTLEYLGCKDVSLLNGGWDKWTADGRTTETTVNTLPALSQGETFEAEIKADILATTDHVKDRRLDSDFAVIDSRKDEEYIGWTLYDEARGGHIPGAVQIPYEWFYNTDKTVLSHDDLTVLFENQDITKDKEVTAYCTAGIRSGFVYFTLRLMGYEKCSNYDDSIYGWAAGDSVEYPMEKMGHYEKVVYPAWVDELIDGDDEYPQTYSGNGYVIIDATSYRGGDNTDEYDAGHIPQSIHLNIYALEGGYPSYPYSSPSDGNLLPDAQLQTFIEGLGITKDTTVIIYSSSITRAGRAAWALMYAGVEDVRILNGGYNAWVSAGYDVETKANLSSPVAFGATVPVHPEYLATTSDVEEIRLDKSAVLADIRRWEEYTGAPGSNTYLHFDDEGRIPGAIWAQNSSAYGDADGTLRIEMAKIWKDYGITADKKTTFYCGTGWRSGLAFFYAHFLGFTNIANYDSGFFGWSWDENNPIATGDYNDFETSTSIETLFNAIENAYTSTDNANRLLLVDVRTSDHFIQGHIKDALSVPLNMMVLGADPLYTNGYDEISTTASSDLADSWLCHILTNQLINDFVSTYADSQIVFYGDTEDDGRRAAYAASKVGYENVSYLAGTYETWHNTYGGLIEQYYNGIESVDPENRSFIMTGFMNNTNFENVSTLGTHHGIIYKGGGLKDFGLLQTDIAPFCFQELLTYLGASPEGHMADGVYYGEMDEWAAKYPNGDKLTYSVTWAGADQYYGLDEIYEEKPSEFQPESSSFVGVGIESRIGGTRESNLNWNPGCIFCFYGCVCGITSNAHANENTWFNDGGIYDTLTLPDDPRNYYAGRYYPRMDILPGQGELIRIKVEIVQ